ncbi:hypothetical protein [endosymbiont GvMRE of Glomus versiforme]|uniref:hypothetical protein n=1 Tax=endosymbiont GvMRE of Glomus versiforme TaxID=2039283 RepID=UPI000EEA121C|nr:hypothetical protein [endosymbiont GvMRE of Glomus versiforme]RHZ37707.1 hypothetical protein GvMRE_I1g529 [endosymbiont GvMRE of Glomus versiforme]
MISEKQNPFPIKGNCQEYLDIYYPLNERYKVKILNLQNKNLTNELSLKDFSNLEVLNCSINRLTSLDISQDHKLKIIEAFRNKIKANLSIFSHLIQLRKLDLGVNSEGFSIKPTDQRFINNSFAGSLESLKNCQELEELNIGYQSEIRKGLEYLPIKKLRVFNCPGTVFDELLKPFDYDVLAWKLFYYPMEVFQREFTQEELKQALEIIWKESKQELVEIKSQRNQQGTKEKVKIERLESKIRLLEEKIKSYK